jgi:hypothetical protein
MDTTKFECFRSKSDGSLYYGEVAFVDRQTNQINEFDPTKPGAA